MEKLVLEHNLIDIILDTSLSKVITFPKEELSDEIYAIQTLILNICANEGVVLPGSIRSGNVFGSLEATYPKPADEGVSASQVVLLSTKKFIDAQTPHLENAKFHRKRTRRSLAGANNRGLNRTWRSSRRA